MLNGKRVREVGNVTKAETLEKLLQKNGQEAASVVQSFTDPELNRLLRFG